MSGDYSWLAHFDLGLNWSVIIKWLPKLAQGGERQFDGHQRTGGKRGAESVEIEIHGVFISRQARQKPARAGERAGQAIQVIRC